MLFGSDYAIWEPNWIVEDFMAFQMPQDLKDEYHVDLSTEVKAKILGLNAARLYDLDVPGHQQKIRGDTFAQRRMSSHVTA
jgi:hypothetical protein